MTALFKQVFFDLVDPMMVSSVILFEALVILIEVTIIWSLLERNSGKAFVASLSTNLLTGLVSIVLPSTWGGISTTSKLILFVVGALIFNILVDAGALKLFYKAAKVSKIITVSTIMNLASYVLLILNFLYLFSL